MTEAVEERARMLGEYIAEAGATVRQAAAKFGVSKSTVTKASAIYAAAWLPRKNTKACKDKRSNVDLRDSAVYN